MAFNKKNKKAMVKIMKKYEHFKYDPKKETVKQFLKCLFQLGEDSFISFENISLSLKYKSIEVEMYDYSASYPLKREYGNNIDYTDFIRRYL